MFGGMSAITKKWGISFQMSRSEKSIIAMAQVVPGGYCSIHFHRLMSNWFLVAEGDLTVRIWTDDPKSGIPDESTAASFDLNSSSGAIVVPSNKMHQFVSKSGCRVIEVYTPDGAAEIPEDQDICRLTAGGVWDGKY